MNEEIKCKGIFLRLALKRLVLTSVAASILLFLGLNIDLSYRYLLSMLFVFMGLLLVFYNNRYEPDTIKLQGEKLEFTFFNKVFFKKPVYTCKKQDVTPHIQEEILEIYKGKKIKAKIRRNAVSKEEWDKLKAFLTL